MEELRDEKVYKHVCKLCNKRYPSGKSLGGHMRSHVIANAHKNTPISKEALSFATVVEDEDEEDDDDDEINGGDQRDREVGNEGNNSVYGLRENPKKTWRLVDSKLTTNNNNNYDKQLLHPFNFQPQQERVCKQCGKGFHSLKALCGHMSSHSQKDKNFKEEDDNSWSSDSKENLISSMETHSDNNHDSNYSYKRQTRSSLSRYRSLTAVGSLGSSLDRSEFDRHEQEEVAMCLMMLSRDSSAHKTCFNFAAESSVNNSVILEGRSPSNYVGIGGTRKDLKLINDKKNIKQVINNNNNHHHQEINNSDSGYFENGAKELESDESMDGFVRNYGFKKPNEIEFRSRIVGDSCYDNHGDSRKRRIREVGNFNFNSPESDENCSKKITKQDYYCYNNNNNNSNNNNNISIKKGNKYECWICNRSFKRHQALGGHIISHRKTGDNSLETSISAKQLQTCSNTITKIMGSSKAKKVKGHKCPYCPRVFKSGQALGGHKRSHMIEGGNGGIVNLHMQAKKSRIERERTPSLPPKPESQHQQPPLIDLNLPAPMEEEGSAKFHLVA